MSRIKYPDKQKIRNQIDIILDKSELFNDSKDKTIHTSDKIVELKPVRQGIPVTKIIPVVVAVAAVIFITTVNKLFKCKERFLQEKSESACNRKRRRTGWSLCER